MTEMIDTTARSMGWVEPSDVSDEEWDKIHAFFDPRANLEPKDLFVFRFNAASNGVDAYYTRQDLETSLEPMALDLQRGQAYMGNHDIQSFAYGTSFDGKVIEADALSRSYEPTFYRQHDRPEYRSTKWLVGDYYVLRGATYNGQSTDDLIMGMLAGIHRKASITFTIGEYVCDIDGREMVPSFLGPMGDDECEHFPGVTYGDSLSTATMKHNSLLETSNVYKNASPGALYVARAVSLAENGALPKREVARVEERIGQRLPLTQRRVFRGGTAVESASNAIDLGGTKEDGGTTPLHRGVLKEESSEMPKAQTPTERREIDPPQVADSEPTEERGPEIPESQAEGAPATEPEKESSGEEDATDTVSEFVDVTQRLLAEMDDETPLDTVAEQLRSLDEALADRGFESTVSAMAARQYETRERAIEEALGGEKLSVEAIRSLKELASVGKDLYAKRVAEAKRERVRALGERANADAYEQHLLAMRDVEYVESEIAAYGDLKRETLQPRMRQTTPPDPTETKATRRVPAERGGGDGREQSNILKRDRKE